MANQGGLVRILAVVVLRVLECASGFFELCFEFRVVCSCGLWVVPYVMSSGCVLIFLPRFVRGELGEFSILGVDVRWS